MRTVDVDKYSQFRLALDFVIEISVIFWLCSSDFSSAAAHD